jgi:diguanylate cyclase (GGDEF)-like protein
MTGMIVFAAAAAIVIAATGLALARARNRELQRRLGDLALLGEMGELLQLSATVEEAAAVLPAFAPRLFPSCDGALYVAGMTPDSLAMAAAWGEPCDMLAFAPTDCWALRCARPHVTTPGRVACKHKESDTPTLCMPLMVGGETLGVLVLRGERSSGSGVADLAGGLAAQTARVIANLRVRDTLRMHAIRDELTGLYNRRYLHDALVRELQRGDASPGVIVADVDNFKRYNDTWGHPGGDALLQQLARLMQRVVRSDDVVCRYGGEEFVIIVPDATFELLHSVAERLREESAQMHIRHDGRFLGRITLSAGIALSPLHGTTVDELIAAADRALYTAKTNGRDRVAVPPHQVVGLDAA